MGNVNYTIHRFFTGTSFVVRWASLSTSSGTADRGQAFPSSIDYGLMSALFSDKSVQIYRPSGADTQIVIQGSNTPNQVASSDCVFSTLTDPQGNAVQLPAAGVTQAIEAILENCLYISPLVSTTSTNTYAATVDLLFSSVRSTRSGM
mgnify:CR=1 FL=1